MVWIRRQRSVDDLQRENGDCLNKWRLGAKVSLGRGDRSQVWCFGVSTLKCEASGHLNGRWPVQEGVTDNARRVTVGGDRSHKPCGFLTLLHCAPNCAVYFIEDFVGDFAGCRPNVYKQ